MKNYDTVIFSVVQHIIYYAIHFLVVKFNRLVEGSAIPEMSCWSDHFISYFWGIVKLHNNTFWSDQQHNLQQQCWTFNNSKVYGLSKDLQWSLAYLLPCTELDNYNISLISVSTFMNIGRSSTVIRIIIFGSQDSFNMDFLKRQCPSHNWQCVFSRIK